MPQTTPSKTPSGNVNLARQSPRKRHGALLAGLASLLGIALPHLESGSGLRLRSRNLQLVVGAFEHALAPDADADVVLRDPESLEPVGTFIAGQIGWVKDVLKGPYPQIDYDLQKMGSKL